MSDAKTIYASFTTQQKQFVSEKTISTTLKVNKWLRFFTNTAHYDEMIEKSTKRWTTIAVISFIACFLSFFFIALFGFMTLAGTVFFLALGIISLLRRKKNKEKDLSNYLRKLFIPILHVLQKKAGDHTRLAASLDFRIPRKAIKPEESKVLHKNLKLYQPKYIISKVTLKDKTILEFVVADDIKDFTWTKRSSSGKTKFKSKSKVVHHCFIKMTIDKEEYNLKNNPSEQVVISDHNGSFIAKVKVKIKVIGKNKILHPSHFFNGMQLIYDQFIPLNPKAGAPPKSDDDETMDIDQEVAMGTPYIWYGAAFDQYDYDSFDHDEEGEFIMDDGAATVFDS